MTRPQTPRHEATRAPQRERRIRTPRVALFGLLAGVLLGDAAQVWAYAIASELSDDCHERITRDALRAVRAMGLGPALSPDRDERALIDDLPFSTLPEDRELAATSLLLGVRDNDLKGHALTSGLDLVLAHGDPAGQREHCLRTPMDDDPSGNATALAACRAFLREAFGRALDGLGPSGEPNPARRVSLRVSLAIRRGLDVSLPRFWVHVGQAMHALQDAFTHTYRTTDGLRVTTVLNWVDFAEERHDERRDGPAHLSALDDCNAGDALRRQRLALATRASTELLQAALAPGQTRAEKESALEGLLTRYLTLEEGCGPMNEWCQAPERALSASASCATASGGLSVWPSLLLVVLLFALRGRRGVARVDTPRGRERYLPLSVGLLVSLCALAAQAPTEARPSPRGPATSASDPALKPTAAQALDRLHTPISDWGLAMSAGASIDRAALAVSAGVRRRLGPQWLLGLDAEWNPWIVTSPLGGRAGALSVFATVVRRHRMRRERVSLRTTVRVGASILLFDLYGARSGSVGPYVGVAPLGIDLALAKGWRLVIDPLDFHLPVPHVTGAPLYYPQYRFTVGFELGG